MSFVANEDEGEAPLFMTQESSNSSLLNPSQIADPSNGNARTADPNDTEPDELGSNLGTDNAERQGSENAEDAAAVESLVADEPTGETRENVNTLGSDEQDIEDAAHVVYREPAPGIPYNPRHRYRKEKPYSVMAPIAPGETEWWANHSRNPLRQGKYSQVFAPLPSSAIPQKIEPDEVVLDGNARQSKRPRYDQPEEDDRHSKPIPRMLSKLTGDVANIASHYNQRTEVGVQLRTASPIYGLKTFNNWVKSVLIKKYTRGSMNNEARGGFAAHYGSKVLDLGCGKGGDLKKWSRQKVRSYTGLDIAEVSVSQARDRLKEMRNVKFLWNFAVLDCFKDPLSDVLSTKELEEKFDTVSMQFCLHYAFETSAKAKQLVKNVADNLRSGGRFIGTIPNAERLLDNLNTTEDESGLEFGNDVYRVRFEDKVNRPVFGHKYHFYLEDAVEDVPEYLVHWSSLIALTSEAGLDLIYKKDFHEIFLEEQAHDEFRDLLTKMGVTKADGSSDLTSDQFEAANLYIAFAFQKRTEPRPVTQPQANSVHFPNKLNFLPPPSPASFPYKSFASESRQVSISEQAGMAFNLLGRLGSVSVRNQSVISSRGCLRHQSSVSPAPVRMLLFGKPGSGKGTLSRKILNDFSFKVLSTGDLLRSSVAAATPLGLQVADVIKSGSLVSDDIVLEIVHEELAKLRPDQNWILDGFPRTLVQGRKLDGMLSSAKSSINLVVNLDVPDEVILERITNRWVHLPSGRIYNYSFNQPKVSGLDDITGEPLIHRPDDQPDVFAARLKTFYSQTHPLLAYYAERPSSVKLHRLAGNSSDVLWPKLKSIIETSVLAPTKHSMARTSNAEDATMFDNFLKQGLPALASA